MADFLHSLHPACAAGIAVLLIGGIFAICLFAHFNPNGKD